MAQAPAEQVKVSGRFTAFLTFVSYLVPYMFSLPLLLLGFALPYYERLPQGLKRTVLHVVGVQESALVPIAPVLGLILIFLSMAVSAALSAAVSHVHVMRTLSRLSETHSEALVSLLDSVGKLVDITRYLMEPGMVNIAHQPLEPGKTNADLAAIKHEIEQSVSALIRETEQRLQSEWRFVVALISAVILGAVAIFVALLALK